MLSRDVYGDRNPFQSAYVQAYIRIFINAQEKE